MAVESPEERHRPTDADVERHGDDDDDVPEIIEKLRAARERHARRPRPIRWLVATAGFTVLLGGAAMLVLPGPALAVIPIGLFLLALEFSWAEEWLERSVKHAERAKQAASETSTLTRVLTGVAIALAVGGAITWALVGDVPLLPV